MIVRQILGKRIITTFDNENYYTDQTTYVINKKDNNFNLLFLLSVMNSKLMYYYFKNTFSDNKVTFPKVKRSQILKFPIKKTENQQPFIEKADKMLTLNKKLQTEKDNFSKTLQEEKGIEKLSKKLQNFQNLEYEEFKKELRKKKIKISLGNENNEWREYFNTAKQKINGLQNQINQTDTEIDKMVYELYELTAEEIEIVENSVK